MSVSPIKTRGTASAKQTTSISIPINRRRWVIICLWPMIIYGLVSISISLLPFYLDLLCHLAPHRIVYKRVCCFCVDWFVEWRGGGVGPLLNWFRSEENQLSRPHRALGFELRIEFRSSICDYGAGLFVTEWRLEFLYFGWSAFQFAVLPWIKLNYPTNGGFNHSKVLVDANVLTENCKR